MDTTQAHLLGYATSARIGLRNSQADGIKTATAADLHQAVGNLVGRHTTRLTKKAARIEALHKAIIG